jgi:hypothetical protein
MVALGPMGIVEYNEQKNKHALGKQDLLEYIIALEEQCILRHGPADEFKRNIGKIFGEEDNKGEKEQIDHATQIGGKVTS